MFARRFLLGTLVVLWSSAAWADIYGFAITKIEGLNGVDLDDRFGTTASATEHKVNYQDCLAYLGIEEGQSLAEGTEQVEDAEVVEVADTTVTDTTVTDTTVTDTAADTATDASADGSGGGGGDTTEGVRKISIEWAVNNSSLTGKWWYSIRIGSGCSESAEVDVEATDTCTYLRQKTELDRYTTLTIEVPVTRLLGTECSKGDTGEARLYFTVQSDTDYNLHDNATLVIEYDYDAPKAVTDLTIEAGETNLSTSWTDDANTEDVTYNVYWYDAEFDDGTKDSAHEKTGLTATDYQITDLENGTRYWVAVVSVDDFDNESSLSDRVEGTPVQVTDGFEFYKGAGGGEQGGFGCATGGTGAASAAVLLLVGVALAAAFAGARRPSSRRGA